MALDLWADGGHVVKRYGRVTGGARIPGTVPARLIGVAAASALALALTGCGSSAGDDAKASTVSASAPGATVPGSATTAPSVTPSAAATTPAAPVAGDYDPARDAAADIAAARTASAKDGRPVLIDFGANWCPDCVVLGKTFTRPSTAALLGKYHLVRVDVGEFDHNLRLTAGYVNLQTSGIPALAVVDAKGHLDVATDQGEFANARSMPESQVDDFLKKWV
ncbi:thioredoxin family protein [Streptomyces sp. NBC_01190]|uniref:thioredoxin family protein n=1 Tax=Streptomyces sp. NBC_01190 TaxID=2903767 RepID=UPI00386CF0C6|nr:thioredoxin family protein [Streptomyces sp. NBC_01190]